MVWPLSAGCGSKELSPVQDSKPTESVGDDTASVGDTASGVDTSSHDSGAGTPPDTGAQDSGEVDPLDTSLPYDQVCFRSSHNSYSGEERGSILTQLESGVRQVEFDFHDNDYESEGYRLGHGSPGSEVDHDGTNPSTDRLEDWLMQVSDWSATHPDHAPIHVLLNIKDDMTDNRSTAEGSFAALNTLVLSVFGERLFWARSLGEEWPSLSSLRGKVIVGLTGRETTGSRVAYLRDRGVSPAVAMNDHGQIIEVHQSESHDMLWYWTGQLQPDGRVIWWHHGRYDSGRDPAIALNNHGMFVEVHRSHADDDLWTWTGRITEDGDLEFLQNEELGSGVQPSIAFTDIGAYSVREIHTSPSDTSARWARSGALSADDGDISWSASTATADLPYDLDAASAALGSVSVSSLAFGASGADTLVYQTSTFGPAPIRYAQIAFIDSSWGDPDVVNEATRFRSFPSGSHDRASAWREGGGISRMWSFSESDATALATTPPQFGATDEPLSAWYSEWAESNDCAD